MPFHHGTWHWLLHRHGHGLLLVPAVGGCCHATASICIPTGFLLHAIGCGRLAHELLPLLLIFAGLLAEELLLEPRVPVILYVVIRPSRQLGSYYRPPTTTACMVRSNHRLYRHTHVAA
jgi:hypothetical protein